MQHTCLGIAYNLIGYTIQTVCRLMLTYKEYIRTIQDLLEGYIINQLLRMIHYERIVGR